MSQAVHARHYLWAIDRFGVVSRCNRAARKWTPVAAAPPSATALALWPTADRVLVASAHGTITVCDAGTGEQLFDGHACEGRVTALFLDEGENALFVGSESGMVTRLELSTLAFVAVLGDDRLGHAASVRSFSRADEFLFSGGDDASIFVWNVVENVGVRQISMTTSAVTALLFVDRFLWVGEADGTVQVLDIYGEDSDRISCVVRKRAHKAPVAFLTAVGTAELWSASAAGMHLDDENVQEDASVDDSIAVWDLNNCALLRRQAALPKCGLLGLLVRNLTSFEKVTLAVVDNSLACTEITVNVHGGITPEGVAAMQKQSAEILAGMERELGQARDEIKFLQDSMTASANGVMSRPEKEPSPNRTPPRLGQPPTTGLPCPPTPVEGFHTSLRQTLARADDELAGALETSEAACSVCARLGKTGLVDARGVQRAANEVSSSINMLKLTERDPRTPGPTSTPLAPTPGLVRAGSSRLSERDFETVRQERDVLAEDLTALQRDSEKTVAGLEELLAVRVARCRGLEEDLERATVEAGALEAAEARVRELELLVRQQLQHIESTVRSFEPRMNEHVETAYTRMTADRDEIEALKAAKAELEVQLADLRQQGERAAGSTELQRVEVDRLRADAKAAEEEVRLLRADKEDFSAEISLLRKAATAHNAELDLTKRALSNLRQAVDEMQKEIERHEKESAERDLTEKKHAEVLDKARARIGELDGELEKAREEGRVGEVKMSETVKELEASLASSKREVARLARESGSTFKRNRALENEVADKSREAEESANALSEANADRDAIAAERDALAAELAALRSASAAGPVTPSLPPASRAEARRSTPVVGAGWSIQGVADTELRDALEAAAESTRCTQEVVKELAVTAKAYKKAAAFHAQSQAGVFAILKRVNTLSKRKSVSGAQLAPVVDGLLAVLYKGPAKREAAGK